jgi:DNA-binding transcriptional ArsR family regulator
MPDATPDPSRATGLELGEELRKELYDSQVVTRPLSIKAQGLVPACPPSPDLTAAKTALPDESLTERLASLFHVLGDPTRVRILSALGAAELRVGDLEDLLEIPQSTLSHQLALLRAARLVRGRRDGKVVFYSLDDDHVRRLLVLASEHAQEGRVQA